MDSWFHRVAIWEGISYLVLLLIAMPLKYVAGWDLAVRYVGWAHGVLFVLYVVLLAACWREYRWSFKFVVIAFLASLVPAGPFFLRHPGRATVK